MNHHVRVFFVQSMVHGHVSNTTKIEIFFENIFIYFYLEPKSRRTCVVFVWKTTSGPRKHELAFKRCVVFVGGFWR